MNSKKIALLLAVLAAVAAFFYFDLHQWLTLDRLKSSMADLQAWKAQHFALAFAVFFLVYVAVTALSLPGAAVMTLAAGALFGLWWGLLLVSFASSIGATLAFLASRYVLGGGLQAKFGDRLKAVNAGIEKDGAFYLFTMRLVPAIPFFVINLVMGLTKMRASTFYWVSQIGMLAGTFVYVNAGTQLAQIDSLSGILSPRLIGSFVLLGVFPFVARACLGWLNRRRVYKGWKKPKRFDRNIVAIGAGAAGLVTAYIAAAVKAKVTLVESHKMGGDCLNYGCVPSKAIIKSARVAHQMRHADQYGLVATEPQIDFKAVMQRVNQVVAEIEPHDSVERYTALGVDVVQGRAMIIDPWTVEIAQPDGSTQTLTTRNMVIATGAAPFVPDFLPPLDGAEDRLYVTSDTLWETLSGMDAAPQRVVVLGGGPIGCELSQALARLGSSVQQVERGDALMGREDADVSEFVQQRLQADGVQVLTQHNALRCEQEGGEKYLVVEAGDKKDGKEDDKEKGLPYDLLLVAVGRRARLEGFGLDKLGIETGRTITTNDYLQTNYPNIYAAGDVAGPYQFTHAAAHQAWYATVNALFGRFKRFKVDYTAFPQVTFVDPEVARAGLNEKEAQAQGVAYEVTRYGIDDLDRAIAESAAHGWVKVLTTPGKDRILGVTIVGMNAGELIAEYVLAMKHGLGLNKILGTVHAYPSMVEANKYAAGEWKRAHQPEKLLKWVERFHGWMRAAK